MFEAFAKGIIGPSRVAVMALIVVSLVACSGAAAPTSSGGGPAAASIPGASAPASVAAGGGGTVGGAVAAGGDLCKLLGPGDFAAVGVTDASGPTENPTDPLNNYCVYRGKSSGTGGIEFDVSVSDTADDAHAVFPEMFGEYPATSVKPVTVAGADEALLHLPSSDGSTDPALIGVRKGKLTFGIGMGIPFADAQQASQQLQQLAALVLQRASGLG
jgi:hypothetical protein